MIPLTLLWRYFCTRRLHFSDRQALENWQAKGCIYSGKTSYLKVRGFSVIWRCPLTSGR